MLRTQIYLPEDYYNQLNNMAKQMNISMGKTIRIILKKGLEKQKKMITKGNDLYQLANLKIKGGPKDLSQKIDKYLYA